LFNFCKLCYSGFLGFKISYFKTSTNLELYKKKYLGVVASGNMFQIVNLGGDNEEVGYYDEMLKNSLIYCLLSLVFKYLRE